MGDRKAYMAEYMRQRRAKSSEGKVNEHGVNRVNAELTEERLRAIVREEIERAVAPLLELLTGLTVNEVSKPAGANINSWPEPRTVACGGCGKEFPAIRANAQACSPKCGKRIWNAKRRGEFL
jgi:hypothetical protein